MPIAPWRATSIQIRSERATQAADNAEAKAVLGRNMERLLGLITEACKSAERPDLVVFPEFALSGPPLGMPVPQWIERACSSIPGPLTAPLQALAAKLGIYISGNLFEAPPEWPGRYFNSSFLIDRKGEIILNYRRINTAAFPSPHDFMTDYLAATPQGEGLPGGGDRARPAGGDPLRRDQRARGRARLHDAGRRGHPPPDQLEILGERRRRPRSPAPPRTWST